MFNDRDLELPVIIVLLVFSPLGRYLYTYLYMHI